MRLLIPAVQPQLLQHARPVLVAPKYARVPVVAALCVGSDSSSGQVHLEEAQALRQVVLQHVADDPVALRFECWESVGKQLDKIRSARPYFLYIGDTTRYGSPPHNSHPLPFPTS